MAPDPLDDMVAAALAGRISRREFLARALALGLSTTATASLLAACGAGNASPATGTPQPSPSASGGLPEIVPTPREVTYGPMLGLGALACCACPDGNLSDRLAEVASDAGIALSLVTGCPSSGSTLRVSLDAGDLPPQGYRLSVTPANGGAEIRLEAPDEAGAFFGLQSVGQLVTSAGASPVIRQATITDAPSFERRGLILDPPWLDVLRFGVPYKLNLMAVAGWSPQAWSALPDLTAYCGAHYVEVMAMVGYQNVLTDTPMVDLKATLGRQFQLGVRSFCLKWDDIHVYAPEAIAATHARIFNELYAYLRLLDPATKISAVLPPYGGVPPNVFDGSLGMTYLSLMRDQLPADVVVFWTGDGGVFSESVTTAGAQAYASAVGHPIGLWDNNALWFAQGYKPLSGRDDDLASAVSAYMGNMNAHETSWAGSRGHFALLTELQYAWRAETYDTGVACSTAERLLHASGLWQAPGSTCAPPGASWTPGVIPPASPMGTP
jgi:beta-N-acetylglucosaminidase/Glycosyl hydrolase family 20, domain 2